MEINKAIRTAYFTALNGNVLDKESNAISFYDAFAIPNDATYPYVVLSSQTATQVSLKRCKKYNTTMVVDIVTGSTDPIGRSESEDIAEQITDIITPDNFKDLDLTALGYQLGNTEIESDNYINSKNDVYYIFRKIITFKHLTIKL